ncbi:Cof-type HAD-IIB family hydrolase [Sporosarcina sp. HYO08]|uniref:Cof-type HAD-IIB family hydrolase n=1 Tax=Sporosarcina sp. HYO08 TaxID=1759557 RepID=UPI00079BFD65|nr:Cof-type HAD-IIB family hydrolase [Sporosarcina sp. HYO08]KXH78315.1 hypothetical protein AU377_13035 [Sporosarcina sp. HYO08]
MTKKMIMFDIDGTLLDHDKQLPASAKESIQLLQEAGHDVAIATGRPTYFFEDLREELGINSFVCFNGQYVEIAGEVIYKNPIDRELLAHLAEYSISREHPMVFLGDQHMRANVESHPDIEESLASLQIDASQLLFDEHYFKEADIYQALLYCKDHEESYYQDNIRDLNFIRWHEYSVDVLPLGGSKAVGIEKFIEKAGYSKDDVYAFGDNLNDIEMLQYVGHGVAMGNAPEQVKKVARYVTKDVSEDGIAYGLEMVGLLK